MGLLLFFFARVCVTIAIVFSWLRGRHHGGYAGATFRYSTATTLQSYVINYYVIISTTLNYYYKYDSLLLLFSSQTIRSFVRSCVCVLERGRHYAVSRDVTHTLNVCENFSKYYN